MCSNSAIFGQQFDCISDLLVGLGTIQPKINKKGCKHFHNAGMIQNTT